jgi:hypothetical protein
MEALILIALMLGGFAFNMAWMNADILPRFPRGLRWIENGIRLFAGWMSV